MDELLDLSGKWRNREKKNCDRDRNQCHKHERHAKNSWNAVLFEPVNERIENHREEKDDREKQEDRSQRTQNGPPDNKKEDEQNNPPRPGICERFVLVVGFCHEARDGLASNLPERTNKIENEARVLTNARHCSLAKEPNLEGGQSNPHGASTPFTTGWRLLRWKPDCLTSEDDVFFRPGVDFLTMRTRYLAALDFGSFPQLFSNRLPTRG